MVLSNSTPTVTFQDWGTAVPIHEYAIKKAMKGTVAFWQVCIKGLLDFKQLFEVGYGESFFSHHDYSL